MLVALDFETYLISGEHPYPKPVCLSYFNGKNKEVIQGSAVGQYLEEVLKGTSSIIAHNAVFECGVIYYWYPQLRQLLWAALDTNRIICTKIQAELIHQIDDTTPFKYSLAHLVLHYFQVDLSEEKNDPNAWRLRYSELDGIPIKDWPQAAIDYSIQDSVWAYKLYEQQKVYGCKIGNPVKAAVALNLMAAQGMTVDISRVECLEQEIKDCLLPTYEKLTLAGYLDPVRGSWRPKKNILGLRQLVKDTIEHPLETKQGAIAVDKEAMLTYYTETNNPVFKDFLQMNLYDKVLTAFVKNLKAPLIRTQYSTSKSTGRSSSSQVRGKQGLLYPSVNIQQMPRKVPNTTWDIRNCFVPSKPGWKILSIDYAGLELVSAAHQLHKLYGKAALVDTLNSGDVPTDLHSQLAARVMSLKEGRRVSYDEFIEHKKDPQFKFYRQICKAINLGFPGGIGYDTMRKLLLQDDIRLTFNILVRGPNPHTLQQAIFKVGSPNLRVARLNKKEYAIVEDELVALKREFYSFYPELERFLKHGHKQFMTEDFKWVKNEYNEWEKEPMYTYKVKDFVRNNCTYTKFCNGYLMQTPAAIGATNMAYHIIKQYLDHPDIRPLAFIHDEMLFEVRDINEEQIKNIATIMITSMQDILSSVRVTVEAEVMDYWTKSGGVWARKYWKNPKSEEIYYD